MVWNKYAYQIYSFLPFYAGPFLLKRMCQNGRHVTSIVRNGKTINLTGNLMPSKIPRLPQL